MSITAVVGEQRGDEGKGRFTDMLATEHNIVARFGGGPNAGHTVSLPDGRDFSLHSVPSGVAHEGIVNVVGNGCVINPVGFNAELSTISQLGMTVTEESLLISSAAHLILPHHISQDEIREAGTNAQGSTKSGIAPVYADKAMRSGLRMEVIKTRSQKLAAAVQQGIIETNKERADAGLEPIELRDTTEQYMTCAQQLGQFVTDTTLFLNKRLRAGDSVLAEGAQAFLLDIDHGMYDAVTSSSTTTGGIFTGLGVPYRYLNRVVGVVKAVQSHVGGGPFATEIFDKEQLRQLHGDMNKIDSETGTTTGRKRRLGNLDLAAIQRAQMINGTTEMALTKLDWVPRYGAEILLCVGYERKGKRLRISPDSAYKIEESTPVYERLPSWREDVSEVRNYEDLPVEAKGYIETIESHTRVPITMIGVGPRRDQVILKQKIS